MNRPTKQEKPTSIPAKITLLIAFKGVTIGAELRETWSGQNPADLGCFVVCKNQDFCTRQRGLTCPRKWVQIDPVGNVNAYAARIVIGFCMDFLHARSTQER
ncbi:MAG: hypothetical protein JO001_03360 [Alphaproteobacteria bacterium]|nr:hypothetical protein [Alphaproteobacteria bacterium]